MKSFNHYYLLIFALLLLGFLSYTVLWERGGDPDVIQIGGVFHLSGQGAFFGEGERNGARLAIEEINAGGGIGGKKLVLIEEDSATDFNQSVTSIRKLSEIDNIDIIVGPTWFGQVAGPLAEELQVLIVSPSAGVVPEPSSFFFTLWPTEDQEVEPVVAHMKESGVKRIALVYTKNDYTESVRRIFLNKAAEAGIEVVDFGGTAPNERDFRTVIARMKEESVDAIYAAIAFPLSEGSFIKQTKELGLAGPIYSTSNTENNILLTEFPEIEGTFYAYPIRGKGETEFAVRYRERFDIPVSVSAPYGYDAIAVIAEAMRATGSQDPVMLADYLRTMKPLRGIANEIEFNDEGRITKKPHAIKQVKHGSFVTVSEPQPQ